MNSKITPKNLPVPPLVVASGASEIMYWYNQRYSYFNFILFRLFFPNTFVLKNSHL